MDFRTLLKMIWEILKEWEMVKETLFQKVLAYHVPSSIPLPNDLSSLSVIVTGATSGIGFHTAREFARAGAHVILACRNIKAAKEVECKWREEAQNTRILNLEVMELDLASFSSVRKFTAEWQERGEPLHILINNAGILLAEEPQKFSDDGIEKHMHVNHVAPALLTLLLLPSLLKASSSRIINVNSVAHYSGVADTQHWNSRMEEDKFSHIKVYGSSKLAHLMFLKVLATQLYERKKDSVQCIAVHPGAVTTNLNSAAKAKLFFMFDAAQGARSVIFCATSNTVGDTLVKGFAYYSSNCKPGKLSAKATNMDTCDEIWKKTMDVLKLSPDFLDNVLDK